MFFVSVRMRSNFSPARKVRSTTAPRVVGLELRAHERAALARLHVLELDDAPGLPVELDVHPVAELVGGDDLGHRRGSVAPTRSPGAVSARPVSRPVQVLRERREQLDAALADDGEVLDPDAADAREVDARARS